MTRVEMCGIEVIFERVDVTDREGVGKQCTEMCTEICR